MQVMKEKERALAKQKEAQLPKAAPVIDSSDILERLAKATQEDDGTDWDAMDDGSEITPSHRCGCW